MKVLLLSRYGRLGASSRVRFLQYLPYFLGHGVSVEVAPLLSDTYLQALYSGRSRLREVLTGYTRRIGALLGARRFDVVIVEKELFPFMPAGVERLLAGMGVPYVADYDDALFHRYDRHRHRLVRRLLGRKVDVVMSHAALVVAGNEYLAERARNAGAPRVEVIPTVVDTDHYRPRQGNMNGTPVVGWIGTPKTTRYLHPLFAVFEALRCEIPVRFAAVGARRADLAETPVEAWPWSEDAEVSSIQQFDIGIMPLGDTPWERGKCGYKLVQYMACGLPVVASPVGVNRVMVTPGENGLFAESLEEWGVALRSLLQQSAAKRQAMGAAGRRRVEARYSLRSQAPRFLATLREAVR